MRTVEMHEISVSGYYHWLIADKVHHNVVIHTDAEIITERDYVCGDGFFYFRLRQRGFRVAFKQLVKLMRCNGI